MVFDAFVLIHSFIRRCEAQVKVVNTPWMHHHQATKHKSLTNVQREHCSPPTRHFTRLGHYPLWSSFVHLVGQAQCFNQIFSLCVLAFLLGIFFHLDHDHTFYDNSFEAPSKTTEKNKNCFDFENHLQVVFVSLTAMFLHNLNLPKLSLSLSLSLSLF